MALQNEGKDTKGRSYDQVTKDGSSSAGTMGTGGTGDVGRTRGGANTGSAQSHARTDDLMTSATEQEERQGYCPSEPGAMRTGMEGIGNKAGGNAGNRQSDKDGQKA